MAGPLAQFTTRIAYGARQLPRVAWYAGHSLVMRRLADMVREREGDSTRPQPQATLQKRAEVTGALYAVVRSIEDVQQLGL